MHIAVLYYYVLYLYILHYHIYIRYMVHALHALYVCNTKFVWLFLDIMFYVYINPQLKYMSDSVRFGLCLCSARQFCYCLEKLQSTS